MQSPFKNNVLRTDAPVYKMAEDVPRNVNEGRLRVTYSHTDKKEKMADFQRHTL